MWHFDGDWAQLGGMGAVDLRIHPFPDMTKVSDTQPSVLIMKGLHELTAAQLRPGGHSKSPLTCARHTSMRQRAELRVPDFPMSATLPRSARLDSFLMVGERRANDQVAAGSPRTRPARIRPASISPIRRRPRPWIFEHWHARQR